MTWKCWHQRAIRFLRIEYDRYCNALQYNGPDHVIEEARGNVLGNIRRLENRHRHECQAAEDPFFDLHTDREVDLGYLG